MLKEHDMRYSTCKRDLENAVADGLMEEYTNPGFKGQSGFRIPEIVDEVLCDTFYCYKAREMLSNVHVKT